MRFAGQSVTANKLDSRQTLIKPKLEELDSVQYNWFSVKRAEGKPVMGPIIIEKAKKFKADLNVTDSDSHFSEGWLRNFKSRHGIRRLDVTGETRSANGYSAKIYIETFKQIVSENDQSPHQAYNADETGLLWRCLPTSTLAAGDEKTAKWFNKNKDRLTVLLCANAQANSICHREKTEGL